MKRLLLILIFIVLVVQPCFAAINTFTKSIDTKKTYKNSYRWTGKPKDGLLTWAKEVEDRLDGTTGNQSFYFTPGSAPTATEGRMYYDSTSDTIKYRNGSSVWVSLAGIAPGESGSLDDAYNSGFAIDVDGTAVTLTVSLGDNNAALIINANDATNNANGIEVVVAASNTGAGLYVNGTTGTVDLLGDNFSLANTGLFVCVGIDTTGTIIMANDDIISNATNDTILFDTGDEDLKIDFTTGTNKLTFTSNSTGGTIWDFGDFVTLQNMSTITGLAEDFTISTTGNSTGEDLILQQAGTGDNQVQILSSGTSAAAILLDTSSTGGVTISALDDLILSVASTTTADDLTITQTGANNSSILLAAAGTGSDAISLAASAGGVSITAVDDVLLQVTSTIAADDLVIAQVGANNSSILLQAAGTGADAISLAASAGGINIDTAATFDIDVDAVGGKILLTATENAGNTIHIEENGGSAGGINLYANQGEGASATTQHDASIQLHSDAGGIGLYTTGNVADAVRIETNGGVDEFITINNLQGTGADAITIKANAAAGNVNIQSVLGSILIKAEEDATDAILIQTDGVNSTTMRLIATTGTSVTENAAALQLTATAGGIQIQSDAAIDGDVIVLRADGGVTNDILIHNDQGTGTDSIDILSDDGGILLTAAKPVAIINAFELDIVIVPDSSPYTVLANNSGQVHMVGDMTADTTFNLPAEADGLHYKFLFISNATDVQDWIITSGSAGANYFIGGVVQHDEDGELTVTYYPDGNSNDTLGVLTPQAGTVIEMWCDGTNWYLTGTVISATNTGVTFSD
ncbi:hypothetical protein LCGC14_0434530 [marine sediment metagenome]|uniref:Uncharacterized protein n=1 Tax=marine sediment metagenome TaxID=412755 RepID=A0A0F9VWK8_9ZZZZ